MDGRYSKDPDAMLDYTNDWSDWLDGDVISSSSWTADTGITVYGDSYDDETATAWISGGTVGTAYDITNQIVTAAGRTDERTIRITVREK
jgi:hypothetical protein